MAENKVENKVEGKSETEGKAPTNWDALLAEPEEIEAGNTVSLSDIPEAIKQVVERSYKSSNFLRFTLPSAKLAEEYLTLARTYAELREPRLTIRTGKVPSNAPDGTIQFRAKDFEARARKEK